MQLLAQAQTALPDLGNRSSVQEPATSPAGSCIITSSSTGTYRNYVIPGSGVILLSLDTATGPSTTSVYLTSGSTTSGVIVTSCSQAATYSSANSVSILRGSSYTVYRNYQHLPTAEEAARNLRKYESQIRAKTQRAKSSIKKAIKLMFNIGFEEEARIFLKGDTIEVSHPESLFKFVISKYSNSLITRTHSPGVSTPYRLQLYTKSDIHIANLCVYMRNTPVLDQVMALAMFIKSGSEEMILKQANWSLTVKDPEIREILALEYPELRNKLLR